MIIDNDSHMTIGLEDRDSMRLLLSLCPEVYECRLNVQTQQQRFYLKLMYMLIRRPFKSF
jgi:hypothetical protein